MSHFAATSLLEQRLEETWEGKDLILQGQVVDIPNVGDDGTRFLFEVSQARFNDTVIKLTGIVRLGWFKYYYDKSSKPTQMINAGETWQLNVRLKRPSGFMNPAGFDYEKWLFTQRIIATGYVRKYSKLKGSKLKDSKQKYAKNKIAIATTDKVNQRLAESAWWSVDRWRQNIHQYIQESVKDKASAAVLSALLVAVRSELSDEQWQLLQESGTSHLVAISGLHIAVVAGFAFFPVMLLWRLFPRLNERIPLRVAGAVVGVVFALIYALLAGFTLPTQRALLMVTIAMWGLVSRQNYHASSILALAIVAVLLLDPLATMTVSFWLSFLAVTLILIFVKRQIRNPRWMAVKLQVFLSLAMLPLTLLFFGTASLTSPLANLLAIPWVSLVVVPLSLIALLLIPFSTFLSTQLLELSAWTIDIFFKALSLLGESTLAEFSPKQIPSEILLTAFIGLLFLLLPRGFPARYLGILLICPSLMYQFMYQSISIEEGDFSYQLLDVGQGYASVLHTKNHHLVYDTGARLSDSFDLGKLVVGPYLKAKGIKRIDTLLVSHGDNDHRGGADYLIENFQIDAILSSEIDSFKNVKKKMSVCESGQQWQWDGVNFKILSPMKNYQGNDNNRSCVLKVWNQHNTLLLTGDIQKKVEKALLKSHSNELKADVMAVPHHGSKTSSTDAFIKAVSPNIALVSAGYRSRFGHPKPKVLRRYEALGVRLFDTVNHGAIRLDFPDNNTEINIESYRLDKRGFWNR